MDAGTFVGDVYYELGMEIVPEYETAGRIVLKMAWGYYRSAENMEGMRQCEEFLKGDLSPEAKAISVEQGFDKLRAFSEVMQDDLGQKLLNHADGIRLLKMKIKPKVKESITNLIRFLDSEEFRGF
ncbi:hypothetical protein KY338_03275 [Candidatus Woesearchaeota archaeon]|nr:hypothetical protein [Candidatus Woesearchaeota archaeon]MBW3005375.1 hypothetical protein [Candidatus Woesearchaeota archaeon]